MVIRTPNLDRLPIEIYQRLRDAITESNIPILVDLFDWARLPQSFHKNIEAHHEVLFTNTQTTAPHQEH